MVRHYIQEKIQQVLDTLNIDSKDVKVDHSSRPEFGDYTTNIAMMLAKELKKKPY